MAAAGGHWVKASGGPYAGKLNFVPAIKSGSYKGQVSGNVYPTLTSGNLVAVQYGPKDWEVFKVGKNGKPTGSPIATFTNKGSAQVKMNNMNEAGYAKALKEPDGGLNLTKVEKVGATPKNQLAANKTPKAPKETPVTEPGPKTTKAEATAATATAQVKASVGGGNYSTTADFEANKHSVEITTLMGKKEVVDGVLLNDGALGVTKNPKTGEYHLVDAVSGKTISKYQTAEDAFAGAQQEAKNMVSVKAPDNPDFKPFSSATTAHNAMIKGYEEQNIHYTADEHDMLASYQDGGYHSMNNQLWHDQTPDAAQHVDSAMAKSKLPRNSVLIRGEDNDHPLYHYAKSLNVGDYYHSKGYDSTSVNPNHSWGGNHVKLVYRAPKGIPAVYLNKYTHGYHSEYEVLLARNMNWKVIGKTVHQGNVTLTLDYAGIAPSP